MGKRISVQQLPKPILLKKFTELYGYSADAVKAKIRNGVWMEGQEFCYSPDRKIQIIEEGYRRWAFSQSPTAQRTIQEGYLSKKTKFPNVEPRKKSIRIKFYFRGQPCRETLPLEPTVRNQRVAHQRLTQINQMITLGNFDCAAEFPNSPNVARLGLLPTHRRSQSFGELADKYLKINKHLSAGTLDGSCT